MEIPCLYNLPVFEFSINSVNIINFKHYLLIPLESIIKIEFRKTAKYIADIQYDYKLGIITVHSADKCGIFNFQIIISADNSSHTIDAFGRNSGKKSGMQSLEKPKFHIIAKSVSKRGTGFIYRFAVNSKTTGSAKRLSAGKIYALVNNKIIDLTGKISGNCFNLFVDNEYINSAGKSQLNNEIYRLVVILIYRNNCYCRKSYSLNASAKIFDWRDMILYFLFTDRFFKFNTTAEYKILENDLAVRANYYGGNFKGISEKIKNGYFKKLGVNAIWITPVNQNPDFAERDSLPPHRKFTGYHGYWPVDSYKIARNFGTLGNLKNLVKTAHAHNIKILADFVANHIHESHSIYRQHPEYFGTLELPDGSKNIRRYEEYPLTTWFDEFLPAFNYDNPAAVEYIVDSAVWLIKNTGIDGFRLDAVKHIDHKLWLRLRERIRAEIEIPENRVFYMVGESITDREKIMEYVHPGEINGQFDFPLYWDVINVFAKETSGFDCLNDSLLKSLEIYGCDSIMSALLGNHDFSRFMAYADNAFPDCNTDEKEFGWKHRVKVKNPANYGKLKLAFAFLATIPFAPMIYYGDEFGMTGAHDPDNRRIMRFDKQLTNHERGVFSYVCQLIKIRNAYPVFRRGDFILLAVESEYYAYLLSDFNCVALVILSRKYKGRINIGIPEFIEYDRFVNQFSGAAAEVVNNILTIELTEYSANIFISQ